MPSHRSHGRVYVEAPRHNELPPGQPADPQANASVDPRKNGKLAAGASKVPALGGKATKGHTSLSHRIPETVLDEAGRKRVRSLRKALCREYRQTVGAGYCGVGASLLLKDVAIAAELQEQALRRGDDDAVRKWMDTKKTTIAYAREECARVGAAMPRSPTDPLADWRAPASDGANKGATGSTLSPAAPDAQKSPSAGTLSRSEQAPEPANKSLTGETLSVADKKGLTGKTLSQTDGTHRKRVIDHTLSHLEGGNSRTGPTLSQPPSGDEREP